MLRSDANNENIRTAYLYYYASESAFSTSSNAGAKLEPKQQEAYQKRFQTLMHDVLILAKQNNLHVFNALTLMDNPLFLKEQKFEPGDANLHFYLFNWRTAMLPSGVDEEMKVDATKMGGVGVVML